MLWNPEFVVLRGDLMSTTRTFLEKGSSLLEVLIASPIILLAGAALLSSLYVAQRHINPQPDSAVHVLMTKVDNLYGQVRASSWQDTSYALFPGTYGPETVTLEGRDYTVTYIVSAIPGRTDMRKMKVKVEWVRPE